MSRYAVRFLAVVLLLATSAALAQEDARRPDPGGGPPAELREAMEQYFAKRLRAELSLSDEQFDEIVPRIQRLERERQGARRQRAEAVRGLRMGLGQGADDTTLQSGLDRLEELDVNQKQHEQATLAEVDAALTVRQRVQLRFFIQSFRAELQERVRELRDGGRGMPGRRWDGQRRRPPTDEGQP